VLFITNRVLKQSALSRAGRSITFDLADNQALTSLFYCERNGPNDYTEIMSDAFLERLQQAPVKNLLIFIHGFNNLPEFSIFQRAQRLQEMFDAHEANLVQVVPLIWPCYDPNARNIVRNYSDDSRTADASRAAFARLLDRLALHQRALYEQVLAGQAERCLIRINLLAHSMGNRVLRSAMQYWSESYLHSHPPLLFRNTFMVAADVSNDTLESSADGRYINSASKNVLVYHSADDLAMRASKAANAGEASRRLGHTGPYDMTKVPANVWSFDCDAVAWQYDPQAGHTYFLDDPAQAPGAVFRHLLQAIQLGRPTVPVGTPPLVRATTLPA
jgi:esterase/lipase superfamily enzyme